MEGTSQDLINKTSAAKQNVDMAPLMALGKGEILGEAVLGYSDTQVSNSTLFICVFDVMGILSSCCRVSYCFCEVRDILRSLN